MDETSSRRSAEDEARDKAVKALQLQQYNSNWAEIQLHRSVFEAHNKAKMTFREIAEVLGCAPSWAHKMFHKFKKWDNEVNSEWKDSGTQYGAPD